MKSTYKYFKWLAMACTIFGLFLAWYYYGFSLVFILIFTIGGNSWEGIINEFIKKEKEHETD